MNQILDFFLSIFAFIIVLSVVVFIHEFGHYLLGVINKVKIDEFSIGYGKEIFGWNDKRGTRWKICCIPFGGFVKFFGDEDASSSSIDKEKLNKMSDSEKQYCLYFKNVWQRISIAFAGPFFNYLLSFFLFAFVFFIKGNVVFSNKITEVKENSPAYIAGIKVGDRIIKFNENEIKTFDQLQLNLALQVKDKINLTIDRNGEIIIKELQINRKRPVIGVISNDFIYKKLNIFEAFKVSLKQIKNITTSTLKALGQIITAKRGISDMSGPISIAKYSGDAMQNGFFSTILFMAMISVSLGLMNLLPIPILDGGHLMFYIIEIIKGKPLNEKVEELFDKIGFSLLMLLTIFITIKDILGII